MNKSTEVYHVVKQIPLGKVTTYGEIAKATGIHPRVVGKILHNNPDSSDCPCHRVVFADGKISNSYAFGGADIQKEKLISEGIKFTPSNRVLLSDHIFYIGMM